MFRRSYNRALVRIEITTATPLLIRAGDTGLSPTVANLSCVRTNHGVHGRTVYIPGSSLKGVMRQAAEAAVRGRDFNGGGSPVQGACDPLNHKSSCFGVVRDARKKQKDAMPSEAVYRAQCLACRTFGSLAVKGRTSVRDLFPWDDASPEALANTQHNRTLANQVEVRHGVAISRVTGSVQVGPFDQEVVPAGARFWGEIAMENYQIWQLGLLMQSVEELDAGFARLGSSTSRGLGEVRATVLSIVHEQALGRAAKPSGVGVIASLDDQKAYGLFPETPLPVEDIPTPRGLVDRFTVTDEQRIGRWREASLEALRGIT